ncbi:MAG: hypothetical protein IJT55_05590 [Prevotella sp.]|nr:hypothetical protein [Prevotella sp.]
MKKNNLLAVALALTAMVSCTDESFVGDQGLKEANEGVGAISFNMSSQAVTRADKTGSAAAADLSNKFIVYGEKGETAKTKYSAGNLVFPNYTVEYTNNTAYSTTSNTKNWEYVGVTPISQDYVKMYDGSSTTTVTSDAQTIKYWDYSATSYTFTAISALPSDISGNKVVVQKNTTGADNVYQKGYTLTINSGASLDDLYLADRVNISQSADADRTATNKYGGNVTFNFRNILSHVRVGIYETIPGYDISDISFKVTGNADAKVSSDDAFGAICDNIKATGYTGTLTVTYGDGATDIENRPIILAGTPASPTAASPNLILGTKINGISTSSLLGKSATTPTWDTDADNDGVGDFTSVIPLTHSTNLKLKCCYTLYNSVTGETINITDATAEIPFKYLQWKPNYKYTYIFKISDNTNGKTNPSLGPAGLYPITFDATETIAEDGQAEYITTISEPSITTFGVKGGKYTHDKEQYESGSDIYVTFMDGSSVVGDFTLNSDAAKGVNVYLATTTNATTYPITEASVAESLAEVSAKTKPVTVESKNSDDSGCFTAVPAQATEVPGEDGKCLSTSVDVAANTVDNATGYYTDMACTVAATLTEGYLAAGTYFQKWTSALKLTGVKVTSATTALVVEYVKTPRTYKGQEVTIADATAFTAAKAAFNLYTDAACTSAVGDSEYSSSAHYYKKVVDSPGVYAYKVINVAAAPVTP